MIVDAFRRRDRWSSIAGTIGIHLLIGLALVVGLRVELVGETLRPLNLVDLSAPEAPSPPPESARSPDSEIEGGAAPPDLQAEAAPIVAPEPVIAIPRPQPVRAAPDPAEGAARSLGAAPVPGPGTGAGGTGDGTGSGAGGDGTGGGRVATPARRIAGEIRAGDYPPEARAARAEGTVGANVDIGRDGRVTRCTVVQSSGNSALDAATCRLIEQRFRYEPARNAAGEPVPDRLGRRQRWCLGGGGCSVG